MTSVSATGRFITTCIEALLGCSAVHYSTMNRLANAFCCFSLAVTALTGSRPLSRIVPEKLYIEEMVAQMQTGREAATLMCQILQAEPQLTSNSATPSASDIPASPGRSSGESSKPASHTTAQSGQSERALMHLQVRIQNLFSCKSCAFAQHRTVS